MKNLFKNLMLVAVAAMAFTACSEDNNEVNNVEKKTVISGVLNIVNDDTRSGFTGSYTEGEETYYQSAWDGGETIKIFVDGVDPVTTTIDAEGRFEVELNGEVNPGASMAVCSPASAWGSQWSATIPAEQTPRANSVDPAAHVLQSMSATVSSSSIEMSLQYACYGKMTVNVPEDFEIDYVELDLTGDLYFSYEDTLSYTLHADHVEGNTFWFAIPSTLGVSEFTVTAYSTDGETTATKSVVIPEDRELNFNWGKVSTFSVSNLDIDEGIPADAVFTGAAWTDGAANDKLIQFYSNELGTLQLNFYKCGSDNWIDARTYGFAQSYDIYPGGQYSWYKPVGATEALYVTKGSVVVTVVDGQYHFEFIGLTNDSGSYSLTSSFTGEIAGLDIPDTRTLLALPTNVTATADGNIITISWDAVEGADEYYVFCYEGGLEAITTAETSVTIEAAYSTDYSFLIRALANESNPNYRTNENDEVYFNVTTGKDPSIWADVVANNIVWDSSNGAFKMTGEVVSGTAWGHSNDYVRIYINESDRPGNNSIKVGTYTGCGGTSPQAGQFGARLSLYWGNVTLPSAIGSESTVQVSYDETVGYTIVLTHNNVMYGYKGKPEGWVAPSAGGDDNTGEGGDDNTGDDNTGDGGALGTIDNPYTFASVASNNFFLNFEGAENGASLQLDRQSSDVNKMSNLGRPFTLNEGTIIYAGSGNIYNVNGTVYEYAQFAPYSTLEVTKADGNWTCKLKMSVDGGATFTYYTYTGQIANQAY